MLRKAKLARSAPEDFILSFKQKKHVYMTERTLSHFFNAMLNSGYLSYPKRKQLSQSAETLDETIQWCGNKVLLSMIFVFRDRRSHGQTKTNKKDMLITACLYPVDETYLTLREKHVLF
jgi:hypothetical protein